VSQAPPELANALAGGSQPSNIDSLSFQFSSVELARPWFHPEVLAARFWKFANPSEQLSDGNVPARGEWPAYITGVVFARNIVVTEHSDSGLVNQPVKSFPHIPLREPIIVPPNQNRPTLTPKPVMDNSAAIRSMTELTKVSVAPTPVAPAATATPETLRLMRPAVITRLNAATFASLQPSGTSLQPSTGQTSSTGQVPSTVLAFICKRLPKCPNPDPSLTWDGSPAQPAGATNPQPVATDPSPTMQGAQT
jgi:hypothetical protein